jgi:cholesterol oxidase
VLGGDFVEDPIWAKSFGRNLVTVHPLGGCVMGEDANTGVVDHMGRVFSDRNGNAAHDGLFVMDGAVIPLSLGVNPLLTIAALAERSCDRIARMRGLTIDYAFKAQADRDVDHIGLRFTERMTGFFTTNLDSNFALLQKRGRRDGDTDVGFILTIDSDDSQKDAHRRNA